MNQQGEPAMDQVELFSDVRPAAMADDDVAVVCDRARDRVAAAFEERPSRHRRRFAFALAGGGLVAAGAAAGAVALSAGNTTHPGAPLRSFVTAAYTVRPGQDGVITVTIKQLQNPAGLQRALAADGVPALVRYIPVRNISGTYHGQNYSGVSPVCQYGSLPRAAGAEYKAVGLALGGGGFWIRPSAMPKGTVVFIQDSPGRLGNIAGIDLLTSSKLPRCVPVKPPAPQQIVSPQAGQPTVSPKGGQRIVQPPGGSLNRQPPGGSLNRPSPLPSKPAALS
jgi:hypothetical protein